MPKREDINTVLVIGSGPIIIGQACEFDYSGTQACKALRGLGYKIVLVNSNPATIMTDPETADVTYIEPLNVERLTQIIEKERPDFWNLTCGPSKITSTSSKTLGASENGNAKIFASYPASLAAPSILVTNKLVDIPAEQTNKICFIFNTPSHL